MKKKFIGATIGLAVMLGGATPAFASYAFWNQNTAVQFCITDKPSAHYRMGYFALPCWLTF